MYALTGKNYAVRRYLSIEKEKSRTPAGITIISSENPDKLRCVCPE
jgi:hypothetical protein